MTEDSVPLRDYLEGKISDIREDVSQELERVRAESRLSERSVRRDLAAFRDQSSVEHQAVAAKLDALTEQVREIRKAHLDRRAVGAAWRATLRGAAAAIAALSAFTAIVLAVQHLITTA